MMACRFLTALAVIGGVAGCVKPPPVGDGKRYFWPSSATSAKIEYLGSYSTDKDFRPDPAGWLTEVVFGKEAPQAIFRTPAEIDARYGKVAVVDSTLRQVLLFDLEKQAIAYLDGSSEERGGLALPMGVALAAPGEVWVADSSAAEIRRLSIDGTSLGTFGKGYLTRPTFLAIDRDADHVIVGDTPVHRLAIFRTSGELVGYLGERGADPGQFNFPVDAAFGPGGELFVLDALNARVQKFLRDGDNYRFAGAFGERGTAAGSFSLPKALAVSPSGHVYITDGLLNKVVIFDTDGNFLLNFGGKHFARDGKISPGGFDMPRGIAVDEQEGIWVVDTFNRMLHRFQYLNETYLRDHPIREDQLVLPVRHVESGKQPGGKGSENPRVP